MISISRRSLMRAGATVPFVPGSVRAQPAPVSATDLFRYPQLDSVQLAPGGQSLAGVRVVNGRRNLVVVDMATRRTRVITNYRAEDVVGVGWISERRLTYGLADFSRGLGDQRGSGLFAIDRDGTAYRQLALREGIDENDGRMLPANTEPVALVRDKGVTTDEVFVATYSDQGRGQLSSTLRRLNTRTGQASIASLGAPSRVIGWVIDRENSVRIGIANENGRLRVHYRDSTDAPWRVIADHSSEDTDAITPLAFDRAGELYAAARAGRDYSAIFRFDRKTATLDAQPLLALKDFDLVGGLRFSSDGRLVGVDYEGERRATHWFDARLRDAQELIDRSLTDRVNRLSGDPETGPLLVASSSDQDPGRYYLFDASKKQLEQVAVARPWIDPEKMARTDFIRYVARDGLSIPALLTLPASGPRKNLPLVVLHYGGPWVRPIHWGFDAVVQFLAARGYAVLLPAPRASTGFGARHFRAGFKQWGLAMQDDLTDGAKNLIATGVVDAKRVAMVGASYGGYAAMQALVRAPDVFRCAVNWIGVTDPELMHTITWSDFAQFESSRYSLSTLLGDPQKDAAQFEATSPLRQAKRITQPVLMAYGGLDRRVPIVHGERMRAALSHNPNVEWIVYNDEGHGWLKEENNVDFWTRVEAFLARHLA